MNIAVVYCYPMVNSRKYFPLAKRFAETWNANPPGVEHTLYIGCNGAEPRGMDLHPFQKIAYKVLVHTNLGWDIGLFQKAADSISCDLLVCLGAPVHFHRPDWLARIVDSFVNNGPALFGIAAYGSPLHVRTTAFWFPPVLLVTYPFQVGNTRKSRYDFEHGANSFTRHAMRYGFECIMVTWDGCYTYGHWNQNMPGKNNVLVRDQHIHA